MPRRSETIMAKDVAWPWPWDEVPTEMVATPSVPTATEAYSVGPPPAVTST
jgi:hypothetical protein